MSNAAKKKQTTTSPLAAWQKQRRTLTNRVSEWAQTANWPIEATEKIITEEQVGSYAAPVLRIRALDVGGGIHLEPVRRAILGGNGRVYLTAWPPLNRIRLIQDKDSKWRIYTDSNVKWPESWRRSTFLKLARELAASQ